MSARRLAVLLASLAVGAAALAGVPAAARADSGADPVIIVAGTFSPSLANGPLALRLRHDGYEVSIFQLPTLGTQSIRKSARALDAFADDLRARTGAAKVDLVGHSQGGLVARSYVKDFDGAGEVDSLITLGTPNRGTSIANLAEHLFFGDCLKIRACRQMAIGSRFLRKLNAGDDTIGDVRYTTFRTVDDELVRPIRTATLHDGARNAKVQSQCPWRVVGHVGLILDGAVYSGVRQALQGRRHIELHCFAL